MKRPELLVPASSLEVLKVAVIFGADAHQPEKVWNPEALDVAEKMVAEHRLKLADTMTLRRPGRKSCHRADYM